MCNFEVFINLKISLMTIEEIIKESEDIVEINREVLGVNDSDIDYIRYGLRRKILDDVIGQLYERMSDDAKQAVNKMAEAGDFKQAVN